MATIFPSGRERVINGPHQFKWSDGRQVGSGPQSPNVYLTGVVGRYTGIVGGESVLLSRGSTLQIGVPVVFAPPGGGPGTKTLAEMITDINAVFGIAGGAPTNFAFIAPPFGVAGGTEQHGIRLIDQTVGPNTALAEVQDYVGANDIAKNATFELVGLPAFLTRDITRVSQATRFAGLSAANDDQSAISDTFFPLLDGCTALWVEIHAGTLDGGGIFGVPAAPVVQLAFSDGTADYDLPFAQGGYLSDAASIEVVADPALIDGYIAKLGHNPGFMGVLSQQGITNTAGPSPSPDLNTRIAFRVPVPPMKAIRCWAIAAGSLQRGSPPRRIGANVAVKVWGLG